MPTFFSGCILRRVVASPRFSDSSLRKEFNICCRDARAGMLPRELYPTIPANEGIVGPRRICRCKQSAYARETYIVIGEKTLRNSARHRCVVYIKCSFWTWPSGSVRYVARWRLTSCRESWPRAVYADDLVVCHRHLWSLLESLMTCNVERLQWERRKGRQHRQFHFKWN